MLTLEQKTKVLDLIQTGMNQTQVSRAVNISDTSVKSILDSRKRVLVISDTHCGHMAGLTPPDYQTRYSSFYDQQKEVWNWFDETVKTLNPDILMTVGDLVDGKGKRSGGTEQITCSMKKQLEMVEIIFETVNAPKIVAVNGTPYHVGQDEAYESFLKGITIGGHEFPKVHGIQFDLKHKIGGSSTPYGNFTPVAKAKLWNQLWADIGGQPKADIIIRGHVHKFDYCGDDSYLAMVCPALQGWGSKYGVEQCEKIVNTGLLWFDIYDGTTLNNLQWHWDIPKFESQKVVTYEL